MTDADLHAQLESLRHGRAPLPLMDGQATAQAIRLRQKGVGYPTISVVMGLYHGYYLSESAWRDRCRRQGVPARPRGVPFTGATR